MVRLLEVLDDHDDVQNVSSNMDIAAEELERAVGVTRRSGGGGWRRVRALGIDPGSRVTGWGVVETRGGRARARRERDDRARRPTAPLAARLARLHAECLRAARRRWAPDGRRARARVRRAQRAERVPARRGARRGARGGRPPAGVALHEYAPADGEARGGRARHAPTRTPSARGVTLRARPRRRARRRRGRRARAGALPPAAGAARSRAGARPTRTRRRGDGAMIARARAARSSRRRPERLVVDVGGVGYAVHVSLQTFADLPPAGAERAPPRPHRGARGRDRAVRLRSPRASGRSSTCCAR